MSELLKLNPRMEDIPRSPVRLSQEPVAVGNTEPQHNSFHSQQSQSLSESQERRDQKERESCQASTDSTGPDAVVFVKGIYYYTESTR